MIECSFLLRVYYILNIKFQIKILVVLEMKNKDISGKILFLILIKISLGGGRLSTDPEIERKRSITHRRSEVHSSNVLEGNRYKLK